MEPTRVTALFGSPRRGGNTDLLMEAFLSGCSSHDVTIERIYLSHLHLTGCRSCRACATTGMCVVDDEMQSIYTSLEQSCRIVVASPIYFYGVTGQTKLVIDRAQAFWSKKYLLRQTIGKHTDRLGFFISVGATHGERLFDGAIFTIRYFFNAIDVRYAGHLLYRGFDDPGAIRSHPTAFTECFEAGKQFVSAQHRP